MKTETDKQKWCLAMFAKKKYNHLLLVYIVINNCYRQDAIYKQLASYACIARSAFVINKSHWLGPTVSQVLVALLVNTNACKVQTH